VRLTEMRHDTEMRPWASARTRFATPPPCQETEIRMRCAGSKPLPLTASGA